MAKWPQDADVRFERGVLLIVILFFFPHMLFEGALLLGVDPCISSVEKAVILIGVSIAEYALVLGIISRVGRVDVKQMLFGRLPSLRDYAVWGAVASVLGFLHFASHLKYGYRYEEISSGLFLGGIAVQAVMFPLIEESVYRGVCFVALYNYGCRSRLLAYFGSTFLFTMAHAPSYWELLRHGVLGLDVTSITIISIYGLVAAYVYESTGKLLLCVWVHGIVNGMQYMGAMVGYLAGVPPSP